MPDSAPTNVFIDEFGNIRTEFVGHFEGVFGGPTPSIVMEPFQPASGKIYAPEFDPAYSGIAFITPPVVPRGGVPSAHPTMAAAIWAETPDQVSPPVGADLLLDKLQIRAGSKNVRLLDSAGNSAFVQADKYAYPLVRTASNNMTGVPGGEVVRWNFTVPVTGRYCPLVTGYGSINGGQGTQAYAQVMVNEVVVSYVDFTRMATTDYECGATCFPDITASQVLAAGVTYLVRVINYVPAPNLNTNTFCIWKGMMLRVSS